MRLIPVPLVLGLLMVACGDKDTTDDTGGGGDGGTDGGAEVDADDDGYDSTEDCDDSNPAINPGAAEICDGIDNDCDGLIDDSDDNATGLTTYYADFDHDGYGDASNSEQGCDAPTSYVEDDTDCDDTDDDVNPGATEVCDNDNVDEDCDGDADDDDAGGAEGKQVGYPDRDGDGYGDEASAEEFCDPPTVLLDEAGDCDDTNPDIHPDAVEICDGIDNDCDSATTEEGLASFWSPSGTWSDASAYLGLGTSSDPRSIVLQDPGTLQVCEGTYYVSLDIQEDVDVVGAGSDLTVLDGANLVTPVIVAEPVTATVSDVAMVSGLASSGNGGGLACTNGATVEVTNGLVRNNAASAAAGILVDGCTLTLTDTTVDGNDATYGAGGLGVIRGDVEIYGGSFTGNSATAGAGVGIEVEATVTATSVDMGSADTDNSPDDAYAFSGLKSYTYDDVVDFYCDAYGCDDDAGTPDTEISCDNGIDDDEDSYVDCDDSDCAEDAACTGGGDSGGGDSGGGDSGGGDSGGGEVIGIEAIEAGDLVISEIQKNPSAVSDANGEWFEVHNPTDTAIDLEGLLVEDDGDESFIIEGSLVVPAGGYVVFSNNGDIDTNGGVPVDYAYSDFDLGNGIDEIYLVVPSDADSASSGLVIDGVAYSDDTFPDEGGRSMTLDPDALDATSNDDGGNWCNATSTYGDGDMGTPGEANDDCVADTGGGDSGGGDSGGGDSGGGDSGGGDTGSSGTGIESLAVGDLVITEIQKNPSAVADASGEWFEIYNSSGTDFDLNGLVVQDVDSDSFTVSGSLSIPAGTYLVFGNNGDTGTNGGVTVDYVYSGFDLGNGTDEVYLVVPGDSDLTIDSVDYSDATFPDDSGASMTLSPSALDATSNDDGANWCSATSSYGDGDLGTPGDANDTCAAD